MPLSSPPTDCHDIAVLFLKLALNTINPNPTTEIILLYPFNLRFVEVEGNILLFRKNEVFKLSVINSTKRYSKEPNVYFDFSEFEIIKF